MTGSKEIKYPKRKRLRLPNMDYGAGNTYFITICTHDRARLFGQITADKVVVSSAGEMVARVWSGLPENIPGLVLDEFVVMPNHIHAILGIIKPVGGRGLKPRP
jgi:REP element-mobilizing transposase RayT